jgi:hypothetical protein
LFNTILEEQGLKVDTATATSALPIACATRILSEAHGGRGHLQIAKNCRTSVEMIEKYYASPLKNTLDAAAINVRKSRIKSIRHNEE